MQVSRIVLIISILLFISCKTEKKPETVTQENSEIQKEISYDFSKANLLNHVKELSLDSYEGRETGTAGATKAKNYIIGEFKKLNVKPLGENFVQVFPMKEIQGENILGFVKGSEKPNEYIVISAHYDHEGIKNGKIYNGADDDASGISALFAFAEYFQKHPPKHSVILAAFDAEEKGLLGSYYYVDNPIIEKSQIKLNINMDMISRSDKNELYAVGPQHYPPYKKYIENIETAGELSLKIGHKEWTAMSDHAGFHEAKIPFIYFGVEDHKDYHKPTDDFENIHPTFYTNAVQTIISFFKYIDEKEL